MLHALTGATASTFAGSSASSNPQLGSAAGLDVPRSGLYRLAQPLASALFPPGVRR